jgi:signal transduction histidine kinase
MFRRFLPMGASRLVTPLAVGGMLAAVIALGALAVWANVLAQGHVAGLSRAGDQTAGHLRATQALGQIDTHTDLLEDGIDPPVLAKLRQAQRLLHESLRRMQASGGVEWERRLARDAGPDVRRLGPAIEDFLAAVGTGDAQVAAEERMEIILDELQLNFNDVSSDPSQLLNEETAGAAADSRRIYTASYVLIPLALAFMALCAWQLRTFRRRSEAEHERLQSELRVAQRLEAVGQLASGIAHEINTPLQFVGDSMRFLRSSFEELQQLGDEYKAVCGEDEAALERIRHAEDEADLEYLKERVPAAFDRAEDGIGRVTSIVAAMKDFGRPLQAERAPADLNAALRSTLAVAQNEYKYAADIDAEYGELPLVVCNVSEINQVFLNLIVNAAHAISDSAAPQTTARGTIQIRTMSENDTAVITVGDTGPGVPSEIRERIFDAFFTTKAVGHGTGQGLTISTSIVDKHGGSLTLADDLPQGAMFTIRLPIGAEAPAVA